MIPRRTPFFFLRWLAALLVAASAADATEGLRVSADGGLLLRGQPFRGYGVNCFDAFNRTLGANPKAGYDEGLRAAAGSPKPGSVSAAPQKG